MAGARIEQRGLVYLRQPSGADRAEFLRAVRRSRSLHRPWVQPPADDDAFDRYLKRAREHNGARFLACRTEDDAIVGVVNVNEIIREPFSSAFLGYYVLSPFERHGYMREALRLVLKYAFGPLHLHRIEANVQPDNVASLRLVESIGFRREGYSPRYLKVGGRWRDHVRYTMLAEEFRAAKRT